MNDQTIEQAIQAAGANVAPRITPADIEANIKTEFYFRASEGAIAAAAMAVNSGRNSELPTLEDSDLDILDCLTICVMVLRNGFTVTGESACASPENFNAEIGKRIARENAIAKVWPLMGYELRSKLAGGQA